MKHKSGTAVKTALFDKKTEVRWTRHRPFAALMNLTVYPLMVLWTVFAALALFPPAFVMWKMITRWESERIVRHFIWFYGRVWMGLTSPFVRFRKEGFREGRTHRPCIFVVNHLSFLDTYFMAALPVFDVVFALRAWPFKMFWYTLFMRLANYLDVESMKWEKIVRASKRVLARGGCLLFFPEGHRSRDGKLRRFYSGAFRLAEETGVPLVPLCITGTDTLLPPGRVWMRPAQVRLRALPPIDPAAFPGPSGQIEMRKFVRGLMAKNIEEMQAEGP